MSVVFDVGVVHGVRGMKNDDNAIETGTGAQLCIRFSDSVSVSKFGLLRKISLRICVDLMKGYVPVKVRSIP